jgi:Tannase and feruloyl esterase
MPDFSRLFTARTGVVVAVTLGSLALGCSSTAKAPNSCERLVTQALPGAMVSAAELITAGTFVPPAGPRGGSNEPFKELPAFCRVVTITKTPAGTDARAEVWLPIENWNGDLQPAGGGFWGGAIPFARMRAILRTGAATSGSNVGIEGASGPSFVMDHPEKLVNLGNQPFHAMVDQAKVLIKAHYGRAPALTYMDECGGGGSRDAIAEVQRWPTDLDAVVATGMTNYGTHHGLAQMWLFQATHKDEKSFIPESKYPMLHDAVLAACDAKDGVKDGIVEDPPHCRFDPAVLQCRGADGLTCLTAPQVEAVRRIYATPVHAKTRQPLYGPMVPGSELSWAPMTLSPAPYPYSQSFFKYVVFKDPNWDFKTRPANFDQDVDQADRPELQAVNATNPDISAFMARGSKLLLIGGWNDDLGPGNNVTYYEQVVATLGADKVRDSVRLFMVPGMHHCLAGDFPPNYTVNLDAVGVVRDWKTSGKAPDQLVFSTSMKGEAPRKRLVCAYPKISMYLGNGATDNPANFVCQAPS